MAGRFRALGLREDKGLDLFFFLGGGGGFRGFVEISELLGCGFQDARFKGLWL